jgi:hypothetical protein
MAVAHKMEGIDMSMSKDKKARRDLAIKRARRNRILMILAGIIVLAGVIVSAAFLVDWDAPPADSHGHGHDGCADGC